MEKQRVPLIQKLREVVKSLVYSVAGVLAISAMSVSLLSMIVYHGDCSAGMDSSIFEVRDQFRLELICQKPRSG